MIFCIIFEVNIGDKQKQTQLVTIYFVSFHFSQLFIALPALLLLRRP